MKRSVILCFFVTVILQVGYSQSHIVKDYEASRAASNWIKQNRYIMDLQKQMEELKNK